MFLKNLTKNKMHSKIVVNKSSNAIIYSSDFSMYLQEKTTKKAKKLKMFAKAIDPLWYVKND
ncbi:hypothetical protein NZNM25_00430 [Nitrosopumilus zosterae]|uniref:Uncharacterized protein n=1 Tax=Nitrosopumilus zosterae TaxID=718286 RepID=A0A2S2KNS0_9ARCH|nr:hypothetical protein NZNM25_00430 [Nitrosopumilus zosterae]